SQRVRTLAAALSPAYLRFGGTRQDFMVFSPQRRGGAGPPTDCDPLPPPLEKRLKQDWVHQQQVLQAEDRNRKFHPVQFSELTVDSLASFSSCSGLALIFGLNALLRTPENVWNGSNAAALLSYTQQRRYALAWELGNEPNSFERKAGVRVGGQQLGLDFLRLRKMLNASPWQRDAALYGPDVGQPRDHRGDLLTGFLQTGSGSINACTWHHYYLNGRDASLEDFLDPGVLDSLALKAHEVLETVRSGAPGVPVWLGETSSAFGGGAPGLSDAFAAGFMWLDKLGLGARLGLDVVLRQVLLGAGSYHLIDEDLDPLPDFWLSVLHKRLVGPEVLNLKSRSPFARLRVYAHCATRRRYETWTPQTWTP
ncbi:LOW QUALITY PROTEIN: heparanase-like, partial [Menidia menidia]